PGPGSPGPPTAPSPSATSATPAAPASRSAWTRPASSARPNASRCTRSIASRSSGRSGRTVCMSSWRSGILAGTAWQCPANGRQEDPHARDQGRTPFRESHRTCVLVALTGHRPSHGRSDLLPVRPGQASRSRTGDELLHHAGTLRSGAPGAPRGDDRVRVRGPPAARVPHALRGRPADGHHVRGDPHRALGQGRGHLEPRPLDGVRVSRAPRLACDQWSGTAVRRSPDHPRQGVAGARPAHDTHPVARHVLIARRVGGSTAPIIPAGDAWHRTMHAGEADPGSAPAMGHPLRLATLVLALATAAHAAHDRAVECGARKLAAAAVYTQCRVTEQARAARKGVDPSFTRCDAKLTAKFARIERTLADAC